MNLPDNDVPATKPEKDYLEYRGSHVPRVIRFAWTVFFVFALTYFAIYLWPDLAEWIRRVR